MKVLPIAACFGLAQIFAMKALRFYDPGSLKVIAQVNLPITGLLSWLLLKRSSSEGDEYLDAWRGYSCKQWLAIAARISPCLPFVGLVLGPLGHHRHGLSPGQVPLRGGHSGEVRVLFAQSTSWGLDMP